MAVARRDGWQVVRGWAAPLGRERIVCSGAVRTADDGRRALLAAVAGSGLIVALRADRDTIDRFLDDLRRLGPVDHVTEPSAQATLTAGQRALLRLLADGLTVREAAAELGVPLRTAQRRLATARRALGVESTAAAIVTALVDGR
jgi:DNA-binding NarL/FixJ family response regulator